MISYFAFVLVVFKLHHGIKSTKSPASSPETVYCASQSYYTWSGGFMFTRLRFIPRRAYCFAVPASSPLQLGEHTRELISDRKTSHKYDNKDLSRLR